MFRNPPRRPFAPVLVALLLGSTASGQPAGLGEVEFPTSCTEGAQARFDEGLILLHHMMYVQAEAAFQDAAEADPACAMAQWGIAMANFHPMWPGRPSPAETERGMAADRRLAAMDAGTPREAAFIAAARAFYGKGDYPQRLAAWAEAQRAAFEGHPDDVDAGAFAALAALATAARDPNFTAQREAGALLEDLHDRAPNHPGVYHYAIHAYDHPPLAQLGLRFAEGYDAMAPDVPHALHMPSHIFVRLGRWQETADWNERSASAALAQPMPDGAVSGHYAHAADYRIYAHLQMGETEEAERLLKELLAVPVLQGNFGSAYALSAAPARLALEGEDWARAAALPEMPHGSVDWSAFPQARANIWLAKGIGAAREGDAEAARTAAAALREIEAEIEDGYWKALAGAQAQSVEGLAALADGAHEEGLVALRAAADTEDALGKSPVTPGHVMPARELLADAYASLGRTDEAREAHEAVLRESPGRRRASDALRRMD